METKVGSVSVFTLDGDRIQERVKVDFEPESFLQWSKIVQPGCLAIDVGAYTGLYAIAADKLGARLSVAFEPVLATFERLQENVKQNDCTGIALYNVALSDFNGEAEMSIHGHRFPDMASLVWEHGKGKVPVTLRTLDSYQFADVAAIKIDVEKNEPAVLRGARDTLERCRPHLIIEALDVGMQREVKESLPDFYRFEHTFDGRNMYFVPGGSNGS